MKDYGYSIEVNELLWEKDKEIERLNGIIGSNQLGCEKEIERLKKELRDESDKAYDYQFNIAKTIDYINLFAEELKPYFHHIKKRLEGK